VGEQGTLRKVEFLPVDRDLPSRLWVTIEYLGVAFSGILQIDEITVVPKLDRFPSTAYRGAT
jgi:hypothetical protein